MINLQEIALALKNPKSKTYGLNTIISSCGRGFFSLRTIMSCLLAFGLVCIGFILVTLGIVLESVTVTALVEQRSIIIAEFLKSELVGWLSEGEQTLNFFQRYLRTREDDLAANDWLDSSNFDKLHKEFAQLWLFFSESQHNGFCSGIGTPKGTLLLGCQNGLIEWTNSSLKDNPCCNYNETNQPSPMVKVFLDENLNVLPKEQWTYRPDPYDFRMLQNGWYQIGEKLEPNTYKFAHFVTTLSDVSSTITTPWIDSNGTFRGVIGKWFILSNFQNWLESLNKVFPNEVIWIVDKQNEWLIATNVEANIIITSNDTNTISQKHVRVNPEESENLEIAFISRYISEQFTWQKLETRSSLSPIYTPYGLKVFTISTLNVTGFEIAIIMSIPFEIVYSSIFITIGISVFTGIFVVCFFIIFSIFIFIRLLSPLNKLILEMNKVRTMNLDSIEIKLSNLLEIKKLQSSFLFTIDKLQEFKSFLPKSLFQNTISDSYMTKSQTTATSNVSSLTIDDSQYSNSNITNESINSNDYLSNDGSNNAKISREKGKFELNLIPNTINLLVIIISINPKFLLEKKSKVISFFGLLFDKINELSREYGRLLDYSIEKIYVQIRTIESLCEVAILIRKFFIKIKKPKQIKISMFLTRGDMVTGNVGSKTIRKSVFCGPIFEEIDILAQSGLSFSQLDIFLSAELNELLDNNYRRYPIDLIKCKNGKVEQLYYLFDIFEGKEKEWVYSLKKTQERERINLLDDTFDYLKNNEINNSINSIEIFQKDNKGLNFANMIKDSLLNIKKHKLYFDTLYSNVKNGSLVVNPMGRALFAKRITKKKI